MPWFYVDDAFADSKPVMRLDTPIRNEAIGLWVRCGAWAAKEETDGHVPLDVIRSFNGTPRLIRALIDTAHLWSPGGDFDENLTEFPPDSWRKTNEILFKNWSKWQKTRAELLAKRREDAERQKRHRENRKPKGRNAVSSGDTDMSRVTEGVTDTVSHTVTEPDCHTVTETDVTRDTTRDPSRARARRPDPTRPLVVTSEGEGYVSNGHTLDQEPPRRCAKHEDVDDPPPCGACAEARRANDTWTLNQRRAEQARANTEAAERRHQAAQDRQHQIETCRLCDDDGYRNGTICHHNPGQDETNARGRELLRAVMVGEKPPPEPSAEEPDW